MTTNTKMAKAAKALGFKTNTKLFIAACMYLRKNGATNQEVIDKLGGPQLNLLKKVEAAGFEVERTTRDVKGRNVKVYRIVIK